jgi:lipopolysaccharide transport system permease protein
MQTTYAFKIKPKKYTRLIDLKEIIAYRELFFLLVWRELKVRYRQTVLGVLWAVLQPLITSAIFVIVFSGVVSHPGDIVPYSLFVLSGFTVWNFINSSVNSASISLVYHTQLVTKVYFPRMMVPLSAVGAFFFDLLLTLIILLMATLAYGIVPTWKWLLLPFFLVFAFVIASSFSLILSSLNVRFRDVKFIVPFALQVWLFLSPVFYGMNSVPEVLRPFFAINPVVGCLHGFRHILFGVDFDPKMFFISVISGTLIFLFSLYLFHKLEEDFADLL